MTNETAIPVVVGLAVGLGLIVAFALVVDSLSQRNPIIGNNPNGLWPYTASITSVVSFLQSPDSQVPLVIRNSAR